jgi:hypothetical protein
MSYVTGRHSFKVGLQSAHEVYRQLQNVDNQLAYTFNNRNPIQFTMRIGPHMQSNRTRYDGIYGPGPVHARPAHAAGRAALRARVELVPRR